MDGDLKQILELTQDNNKMLHKIRNVQKREAIFRAIKLLVIIGFSVASFYYVEPYLNKMLGLLSSVSGIEQKLNSSSLNIGSLQDILKKIGK